MKKYLKSATLSAWLLALAFFITQKTPAQKLSFKLYELVSSKRCRFLSNLNQAVSYHPTQKYDCLSRTSAYSGQSVDQPYPWSARRPTHQKSLRRFPCHHQTHPLESDLEIPGLVWAGSCVELGARGRVDEGLEAVLLSWGLGGLFEQGLGSGGVPGMGLQKFVRVLRKHSFWESCGFFAWNFGGLVVFWNGPMIFLALAKGFEYWSKRGQFYQVIW